MAKRIEFLEHTGDMLIRAYGSTLAEAYGAAADAMFDIIIGQVSLSPGSQVSFEIDAPDKESLLIRFLSELIVRHEVDRVVFGNFRVQLSGVAHLTATADAEPFSRERHTDGIHIKAVAYHLLEIVEQSPAGEASVTVLFDI